MKKIELNTELLILPDGRILVDLHAKVTPALMQEIRANGGLALGQASIRLPLPMV